MERRYRYALTAGALSSGAAGLLGLSLAKAPGHAAYTALGAGTAAILAVFGYIIGRQADQLAELSETDALTGLFNARGFALRLGAELKRSSHYREPIALLFLDLDDLKNINDRHGHRAGSDALGQMARVIRSELRESDVAARWGGDEFTILAPNTPHTAALALAERIRSRIAGQANAWPLTASLGVATHVGDDDGMPADAAAIMREADHAMYEAKKRGKNTVFAARPPETETERPVIGRLEIAR